MSPPPKRFTRTEGCGCFACRLGQLINEEAENLDHSRLMIEAMAEHMAVMISVLPKDEHKPALAFVASLLRDEVEDYEQQDDAIEHPVNCRPI